MQDMHSYKKKEFDDLLREATRHGFTWIKKANKLFVYHPIKTFGFRTCHLDQKGYFGLKRFIEKK